MKLPVAVVGSIPALTQGWASALRGRFSASRPNDVAAWLDHADHRAVVVADERERCRQSTEACLARRPEVTVVELIAAPSPWDYVDSVERGAAGTAGWDTPVAEVQAMISAGLQGRVTVPTCARQHRASVWRDPAQEFDWIERELLRGLVEGSKVCDIARRIAYSEREAYRRLNALYGRLGVASRHDAVVKATTLRLVD